MEKNNRQAPFVNIGSSLLLVIFLVLCLVTFATLSLSSAKSDASFSERMADRKSEYYQAVNQAEEVLASIDRELASSAGQPDFSKADSKITYDAKKATISYQIPINDAQALDVVLVLLPDTEISSSRYLIQKWQTVSTKEWESDQNLQVLPMPEL